ncbi:hypothetical protein E2C01_009966 [Portunus trituberculatus]|uniref:Uncharacterized protein n=1 Tax=Portunus trituberculatus TaxID=210409 RepID=A0A5B7D747_PORTR|nr:hypothetical protein [Portunus trituberculatus]
MSPQGSSGFVWCSLTLVGRYFTPWEPPCMCPVLGPSLVLAKNAAQRGFTSTRWVHTAHACPTLKGILYSIYHPKF